MATSTTGLANRIGLGVDLENGDDVLSTLKAILETEREIVRTAGRSSSAASQSTGTRSRSRAKQEAAQEAKDVAQVEVSAKRQALEAFDRMSAEAAAKEKRRVTDTTNHIIAEGRRASDVMAQLAHKTDAELRHLMTGYATAGQEQVARQIQAHIEARGNFGATSLSAKPATQEELDFARRILEGAKKGVAGGDIADPNRYYTGQHLGWPKKKGDVAGPPPLPPPLPPTATSQQANYPAFISVLERAQRERVARQAAATEELNRTEQQARTAFQGVLARGRASAPPPEASPADLARREAVDRLQRSNSTTVREAQAADREAARRRQVAEAERRADEFQARQKQEAENRRRHEADIADQQRADKQRADTRAAAEKRQEAMRERQIRDLQSDPDRFAATVYPDLGPREDESGGSTSKRRLDRSPARQARLEESRRMAQQAQFEAQFGGAGVTLDKARDAAAKMQKDFDKISLRHAGTDVGNEAARMSKYLQETRNRAEGLRKEISSPANMKRTVEAVEKDLSHIDRRITTTAEKLRQMQNAAGQSPGEFKPSFGGGPGGGDNPFGAVATAQRIGRNLLIYAAVRGFTTDLREFISASVQAAQIAEQTQRQLEFTSKAARVSFEGNLQVADSVRRELFLSRRLADEAVAEATQVADEANRPQDIDALTRAVSDINAKRGRGVEKIAENIRSIAIGGRGYQELFGIRPADLYQQEAERRVGANEAAGLPLRDDRNRGYLSHAEAVNKVVSALTDEEKIQIRINEVERQGNLVRGATTDRARTMAGQVDILNQKWEDAKVAVGNFVLALTPALGLLTRIAGLLSGIDPGRSKLIGTGQGGQITAGDVATNAAQYPQSAVYRTNQFLSNTAPGLLGAAGIAGAGLFFGRGRARQEYQQRAFRQTFDEGVEFGLTPEQARAEAQTVANQAKPGILRSIGTGLRNITEGITESTLRLTSTVARTLGLEGVAERAQRAAQLVRAGVQGIDEAATARATKYASRLGTAGGVAGGVVGAQYGAILAEKMNVGPITATLLTITGGIVGTAVGTALGQAAGAGIASYGGVGAFLASPAGIAILTTAAGALIINRVAQSNYDYAAREEAISGQTNRNLAEQKAQLTAAREEGRTYFRLRQSVAGLDETVRYNKPGTGEEVSYTQSALTRRFTEAQRQALIAQGKVRPDQFEEVMETKDMTAARVQRENERKAGDEREAKESAEFWDRVRQEEDKKRQETLQRQEAALSKLRDYALNSYQVIEGVATKLVSDNPFVKVFADGATAAERMQQQWGFLGDATVKFYTDLEQHQVALQTFTLQLQAQAGAMRNLAEASRLARERGIGLTGNEGRLLEAYKAGTAAAVENPDLYNQARRLRGQYTGGPDDQLREQFNNLRRNRNVFAGQTAGLGQEAQDAIEGVLDNAVIQLGQRAGNRIFRPGLNALRLETADSYDRQAGRNDRAVDRAVERVRIGALAQKDVDRMITAQEGLARQAVLGGKVQAAEAQRILDRQIIEVTGAVDPKELSNRSYQGRINALTREAERQAKQDEEARRAIKTAEAQRAEQTAEIKGLRQDLVSGKASVLVQVLNDSEARTDTEALQEANADKPGRPGYPTPKSSMSRYK